MAKNAFRQGLISIKEIDKEAIECILTKSGKFKERLPGALLKGKILASLFFESSTRTRLSFESAMKRLGGECIGLAGKEESSLSKGESLSDTIRVVSGYADLIVIRHPMEGSAKTAEQASRVPVINAGDGANEHPTQTLLDLFTIQESQNRLEGLNILIAGDLKHSRTIHSLVIALRHFNPCLFFVSPKGLEIPDAPLHYLREAKVPFSFYSSLEEILPQVDILYMTRIQKERFSQPSEYERTKNAFHLTNASLVQAKSNLRILHPLPRINEIASEVDESPYAYYFPQAENGVFVRAALMDTIFNGIT